MFKIWDGDEAEYFTHIDMNRVEYNANLVAAEAGVPTVDFLDVTRASQFRYDEAQKLEDLIALTALAAGVSVTMETYWSYSRTVSYVDFERWEASLYAAYTALGGTGERIPAGKHLIIVDATLFASEWKGTGPYYIDLTMPMMHQGGDAVAHGRHTATPIQRAAEYSAVLRATFLSDRLVRVWALSVKPRVDIPIRVALGGYEMYEEVSLPVSGWSGDGPWTQTVTLSGTPADAVVGTWEGMTDEAVEQMMEAKISVSALGTNSVTVRAIGVKPTVALNPAVMWSEDLVD